MSDLNSSSSDSTGTFSTCKSRKTSQVYLQLDDRTPTEKQEVAVLMEDLQEAPECG